MITWLASYPKSGNTYFRLLFNGLFFDDLDINNLYFGTGDLTRSYYQNVSPKPLDKLTIEEVYLIRPAALFQMQTLYQNPLLVKTHHVRGEVNGIALIPAAVTKNAFYFIRDPRNVAISFANHLGTSIDKSIELLTNDKAALEDDDKFGHMLSDWNNHVQSWTNDGIFQVTVIKYEKLVSDTETVFVNALRKIGMNPTKKQIERAIRQTRIENLSMIENDKGFSEKPKASKKFFNGNTNWKTQLTEEQINKIEKSCKPMMDRFEYDTVTL